MLSDDDILKKVYNICNPDDFFDKICDASDNLEALGTMEDTLETEMKISDVATKLIDKFDDMEKGYLIIIGLIAKISDFNNIQESIEKDNMMYR